MEVFCEKWGDEASEKNLSTHGLGKTTPDDNEELSSEVEWDPVGDAEEGLEDGEECKYHPVGDPLGTLELSVGEEGTQAVVAWNDEPGQVGQGLAAEVEGNKEKVKSDKTTDNIGFWCSSLLFQVDQKRVLGQLLIKLRDIVVDLILVGHVADGCKLSG